MWERWYHNHCHGVHGAVDGNGFLPGPISFDS